MIDNSVLLARAEAYAKSRDAEVVRKERLGHGSDGAVWRTSRNSAVKAFARQESYQSELECYRRLKAEGIRRLGEFDVPWLEGFDEGLMVIEMSIVRPPFLLDFGKVYLDQAPEYWSDPQMVAAWNAEKEEIYGPENWMRVRKVIASLRRFGIFYVDPRPSNVNLGEDDDDRL